MKFIGVPVQVVPPLVYVGVTVIVPVIGATPALVAVKEILPVPLAPRPMAVFELVQVYTVPATAPVKVAVVKAPEQTVWFGCVFTVGVGLTSTVAVDVGPAHPFAVGVIVKVTVTAALVVFVNVPLIGLPDPLAAMPVTLTVLSLVQVYVVPATAPVSAILVIAVPEQIVCDAGVAIAFGVGLTSTVAVVVGPTQPFDVGVIVKVTVIGAVVVLVKVPDIGVPDPLAAIPVTETVLSLVHV